jgi:hypothetical protein
MNPNDRPYIEFERIVNKGLTARKPRVDKEGKEVRAGHPGEFKEVWHKSLVSHRAPFAPYTFVTSDWVIVQVKKGRIPVGFGNIEKLPANYPAEWRAQLLDAMSAISNTVQANRAAAAEKERLEKEVAELRAQLAAKVDSEVKTNEQDPKPAKPRSGVRSDSKEGEGTSGEAGQAAHG